MKKFLLMLIFLITSVSLHAKENHAENVKESAIEERAPQQEHSGMFFMEHESEKEGDSFESKFMHMLVVLGLLIGFMILASWTLKKMMRNRVEQMNTSSTIKLIETRHLSPRCTLHLVEVGESNLLIAESPSTASHIATFAAAAREE